MNDKKHLAILGSTGSIGTQTLDIIRGNDGFCVEVLTANNNADLLIKQALEFQPNCVVIANKEHYHKVQEALENTDTKVFAGSESIEQVVQFKDIDIVLVALVGIAGLKPTAAAIKAKKIIALANKETMVVAGAYITALAKENNVPILPVDSEHSAIFQCLQGEVQNRVKKILLTASGGAFLGKKREDLKNITPAQALRNPNWDMGAKVTIDSATLMNKGLEVIEARWLFDVAAENIMPVVHPQSIVHSMVEFEDGSIKAQMAKPDMRLPIIYALSYPFRVNEPQLAMDIFSLPPLTFLKPDTETFPCLNLAFRAIKQGGNMPAIMNAANEIAVRAFLEEKISFLDIPVLIEKAMETYTFIQNPSFEDYLSSDSEVREAMRRLYNI